MAKATFGVQPKHRAAQQVRVAHRPANDADDLALLASKDNWHAVQRGVEVFAVRYLGK